jgi:putative membrane protein
MLIELILFLLLGILFGTFTGLIPGIHVNLVGALIISIYFSTLSTFDPIYLVVFIVGMAITHTFLDFIPSVFLGCPDTDTELSILPGHKLLKQGQGYEAIMLTAYGSLIAIIILALITLPSILLIEKTYNHLQTAIPWILIAVSIFLILSGKKKLKSLFIFILSGALGFLVLNFENINEPLLPLLTGLFGASMLLLSIKTKTEIPKQLPTINPSRAELFKPTFGAIIAAPLCSFLPGLGSGQAAIIGNTISKTDERGFLTLVGTTNTLVMGFSFIALYAVSRTRTGAAAAIENIIGIPKTNILVLIIISTILTGIVAFFLTKNIAKFISYKVEKINYTKLSIITLLILATITLTFSGIVGLIVLIIATATGIYGINSGVRRINLMGCLLIPTILFYLI